MHSSDELFLYHCCALAWQHQSLALPNPSVGALVVNANGHIIGSGVHIIAGGPHAEILAIKEAYIFLSKDNRISQCHTSESIHQYLLAHHQGLLSQCTLYVSLEPCNHYGKTPPCAALIAELGFAKVCIATRERHSLAIGGLEYLLAHHINAIHIESPAIAHIASSLLLPFEILRTKGRFVLFKLAMRLDGSYKNGQISHNVARTFTHNQRSICDYICISGATLRADNPKLNARFATAPYDNTKAPEAIIFSRTHSQMPKDSILLHRARFCKDISNLQGFIIVEGGWNLLFALQDSIDMLLFIQSLTLKENEAITHTHNINRNFMLLHQMPLGEDIAIWLR